MRTKDEVKALRGALLEQIAPSQVRSRRGGGVPARLADVEGEWDLMTVEQRTPYVQMWEGKAVMCIW